MIFQKKKEAAYEEAKLERNKVNLEKVRNKLRIKRDFVVVPLILEERGTVKKVIHTKLSKIRFPPLDKGDQIYLSKRLFSAIERVHLAFTNESEFINKVSDCLDTFRSEWVVR